MRKKYKVSLILGLVSSSVAMLLSLISLIYFAIYQNFVLFLDAILNTTSSDGRTILEMLTTLGIQVSEIGVIIYVMMTTFNIMSLLLAVPGFVFSLLGFRKLNLSPKEFQAKHKFNIWRLIGIGLTIESITLQSTALLHDLLSTLSTLVQAASIVALIFGIVTLVENRKMVKQEEQRVYDAAYTPVYNEVKNKEDSDVLQEVLNEIDAEENVQPEAEPSKLDEMYDLLAKLEKSYKNGEVSYEDYERMKKTILDNYLK